MGIEDIASSVAIHVLIGKGDVCAIGEAQLVWIEH